MIHPIRCTFTLESGRQEKQQHGSDTHFHDTQQFFDKFLNRTPFRTVSATTPPYACSIMQAFAYTPSVQSEISIFLAFSCRRPEIRAAPLCVPLCPVSTRVTSFFSLSLLQESTGQWLLRAPLFHAKLVRYALSLLAFKTPQSRGRRLD